MSLVSENLIENNERQMLHAWKTHERELKHAKNTAPIRFLELENFFHPEYHLILTKGVQSVTTLFEDIHTGETATQILHGLDFMKKEEADRFMYLASKFTKEDIRAFRYFHEIGHTIFNWLNTFGRDDYPSLYSRFQNVMHHIDLPEYRNNGRSLTRVAQITNIDTYGIPRFSEEWYKRVVSARKQEDFAELFAMTMYSIGYLKDFLERYISCDNSIISHGQTLNIRLDYLKSNNMIPISPKLGSEIVGSFYNLFQEFQTEKNNRIAR